MTFEDFIAITDDIRSQLEPGEFYRIEIGTGDGWNLLGTWTWLEGRIIVLSPDDERPFYIPLNAIMWIRPAK